MIKPLPNPGTFPLPAVDFERFFPGAGILEFPLGLPQLPVKLPGFFRVPVLPRTGF